MNGRMTGPEKVLVALILVAVVLLGWAVLSYILGMRPTVGLFS